MNIQNIALSDLHPYAKNPRKNDEAVASVAASIREFGFLAKHPTTGNAIPSPYVAMSQSFSKQANNLWYQIYQVVKENCSVEYKGATPHDDMMERLLSARRGG